MTTHWTFKLPDGSTLTGPVQGSGGTIDYANGSGDRRIRVAIDRARRGDDLPIYEPTPGHCSMHTADGKRIAVDLRTAELVGHEERT